MFNLGQPHTYTVKPRKINQLKLSEEANVQQSASLDIHGYLIFSHELQGQSKEQSLSRASKRIWKKRTTSRITIKNVTRHYLMISQSCIVILGPKKLFGGSSRYMPVMEEQC